MKVRLGGLLKGEVGGAAEGDPLHLGKVLVDVINVPDTWRHQGM